MCNKVNIEHPSKWLFKPNNLLFFILVLFFIVFNDAVTNFIKVVFIKNFGYTYSNGFYDFLFLIVSLSILSFYWPKRNTYIPSNNITLLLFALLFFYLYYRLFRQSWLFTSFTIIPQLKYADVLALISLLNLSLWLINWVKCDPVPIDQSKNTLFDDNPITTEENDKLKYHQYAQSLAENIEESNFNKSFALGINGYWGIGKTSFINLIIKNLKKDGKIFIHFNPWDCKTPEAIILDFFEALQEGIRPHHSSLARTLLKYSNRLVKSNENSITKSIHLATMSLNGIDSPEGIYIKINDTLRKINKKVIVVIDDLDRLDCKEISEVLKLIRNTANFYNTFFIVAYDRNYVVNSLKSDDIHKAEHFLEKIFQLEINLPQISKSVFRQRLLNLILPHIKSEYHKMIEENVIGNHSFRLSILDSWLNSMRDVTRLANSIVINFKKLQGEVDFDDFVKLEILRLNYSSIYEMIFRKTDEILETKEKNGSDKRKYVPRRTKDNNSSKLTLEEILNNKCEEDGVNKCEIQDALAVFTAIFPDDKHWYAKNDLSVVYPSNFSRYFTYELLHDDLSEVEFGKARKLEFEAFKNRIDNWINNGLEYLLKDRLIKINEFDDKDDFEKIIKIIFYFGKSQTQKDKSYSKLVGYDANDLLYKLNKDTIKKYYDSPNGAQEYRNFLITLLLRLPPYELEAALVSEWLKRWDHYDNFPITKKQGERLVCFYFLSYASKLNKIDRMFWYYLDCCESIEWVERGNSGTKDGRKYVLPEAKEIAKWFALNKDTEGFLSSIIQFNFKRTDDKNQYAVYAPSVLKIWDSWMDFKDFLDSIQSDSDIVKEFKAFYSEFEKTDNSKYVDFDFRFIIVQKNGI